jgi:hypothetical protein
VDPGLVNPGVVTTIQDDDDRDYGSPGVQLVPVWDQSTYGTLWPQNYPMDLVDQEEAVEWFDLDVVDPNFMPYVGIPRLPDGCGPRPEVRTVIRWSRAFQVVEPVEEDVQETGEVLVGEIQFELIIDGEEEVEADVAESIDTSESESDVDSDNDPTRVISNDPS